LKSTFHGAAPVETWPIVVKELTVVGSRCGPFDKAIALLRFRQSRSTTINHTHLPAERLATGNRLRAKIRRDESVIGREPTRMKCLALKMSAKPFPREDAG